MRLVEQQKSVTQHFLGRADPRSIILEHVGLDEQARPVLEGHITCGKPRQRNSRLQATSRIVPVLEGHIRCNRHSGVGHALGRPVEIGFRPGGDAGIQIAEQLDRVRQEILIICAIGRVDIDEEIGEPSGEQLEPRLHFCGIGFHEVPVHIQIPRRRAPAHLLGAVLVDSVVRTKPLVAVGIEYGNEQNGYVVQQARQFLVDRYVSKRIILPTGPTRRARIAKPLR